MRYSDDIKKIATQCIRLLQWAERRHGNEFFVGCEQELLVSFDPEKMSPEEMLERFKGAFADYMDHYEELFGKLAVPGEKSVKKMEVGLKPSVSIRPIINSVHPEEGVFPDGSVALEYTTIPALPLTAAHLAERLRENVRKILLELGATNVEYDTPIKYSETHIREVGFSFQPNISVWQGNTNLIPHNPENLDFIHSLENWIVAVAHPTLMLYVENEKSLDRFGKSHTPRYYDFCAQWEGSTPETARIENKFPHAGTDPTTAIFLTLFGIHLGLREARGERAPILIDDLATCKRDHDMNLPCSIWADKVFETYRDTYAFRWLDRLAEERNSELEELKAAGKISRQKMEKNLTPEDIGTQFHQKTLAFYRSRGFGESAARGI